MNLFHNYTQNKIEEKKMEKRNSNLSRFKWYMETNKNEATLLFQTNKQDVLYKVWNYWIICLNI